MKVKELKELDQHDLVKRANDLKKEIFDLRQEKSSTGKAEKPARFKTIRKENARIQTILNERKVQDGKQGK